MSSKADLDDDFTPIDRPLLLSDLNDIRRCVHNIESVQLRWYEESKALTARVGRLEAKLWLPAIVSIAAAAIAVLARVAP